MANFIDLMRKKERTLAEKESKDISQFANKKKNKQDFESFLQSNLAYVRFNDTANKEHIKLVSSNTALISMLRLDLTKPENISKAIGFKNSGIFSKSIKSVDTWDILENHILTIPLKAWEIINFITTDNQKDTLLVAKTFQKVLKQ